MCASQVYTLLVEKMLEGIEVKLNEDFFDNKEYYYSIANKIVYTGALDKFFDFSLGKLEYRSLKFETQILNTDNYQGNAVVNYTGNEVKYTRVIEHKHFENIQNLNKTIITYEYPDDWNEQKEPYYVVNDDKNNQLAEEYRSLAKKEKKVIFGGRLAEYKYYDMDDVIKAAFESVSKELN